MISRFAKSLGLVVTLLVLVTMLSMFHEPSRAYIDPWTGQLFGEGGVEGSVAAAKEQAGKHFSFNSSKSPSEIKNAKGSVIMPKLGNETVKAELGRATWKLMHTMTLRYPKTPTADEREALNAYFHLTSRLYPCGECAAEFQLLLAKYPPQTSSRLAASQWLCGLHNEVNKRLQKPMFDCAHVDATYDCGCGDADDAESDSAAAKAGANRDGVDHDELTGADLIRGGRR